MFFDELFFSSLSFFEEDFFDDDFFGEPLLFDLSTADLSKEPGSYPSFPPLSSKECEDTFFLLLSPISSRLAFFEEDTLLLSLDLDDLDGFLSDLDFFSSLDDFFEFDDK